MTPRPQPEDRRPPTPGGEKRDLSPGPLSENTEAKRELSPRERSNANLKLFQPGKSGNPAGRPKKKPITEIYDEIVEEDRPAIKARVRLALLSPMDSPVPMLKEMADRIEGRSVGAEIEISADAKTINVNILQVGGNE